MGEARRRREAADRQRLARARLARRVGIPAFVALLAVGAVATNQLTAHAGDSSSQAEQARQPRDPNAENHWEPRPEDYVSAYVGGRQEWKRVPLREVEDGQEFTRAGNLYYRNSAGVVAWVRGVQADQLNTTLAPHDRRTHRSPEADDVVEILDTDRSHDRFALLRDVPPDSHVMFMGAVYHAAEIDGYLAIKPTGDVLKRVVRTFKRPHTQIVDLSVQEAGGSPFTISGTPEHPFYVPARGEYVAMGELREGVQLHTAEGTTATVVESTRRTGSFTVYNFEVEDTHNYYVRSADGGPSVLVHNTCKPPTRAELLEQLPERVYAGRVVDPRFNAVKATPADFNPRAYTVKAGDIGGMITSRKHGISPDQAASVRQLSNEDLVKFRFEDPISSHGIQQGIQLTGGHHRTAEIIRRVQAGELPADTKVHLLLHD
ncbi:MAG TPA: hypothetical protein DEA08_21615 [Planctomycetes bacterium]|nr:hypothetical protein [Planctomycetota bacterium]